MHRIQTHRVRALRLINGVHVAVMVPYASAKLIQDHMKTYLATTTYYCYASDLVIVKD